MTISSVRISLNDNIGWNVMSLEIDSYITARDVSYLEIHDGRLVLEAKTRRDVLNGVQEPLNAIHVRVGLSYLLRNSKESSTRVTDGEGFSRVCMTISRTILLVRAEPGRDFCLRVDKIATR